ncbi:TadE-like protein [Rubripirellula amarantea]|uniref:TadE-like protein n=1 Tax=Rubripirellula amarantea TaxID=2527999 RepID=A0A5C5WZ01_9BACT|nr:TadE/TadG family type IV pilus assembly protein [Rubripirellula amarantea]TWT55145.1 TadE-like protein [Rubripirellula amarantea]
MRKPHSTTAIKRVTRRNRRGAAAVEFALVVPVVFLLFFAALEFTRVAMIRHTADNAVYEGCRVGIIPGATSDEVRQTATDIMATLGVTNVTVDVQPGNIDRDTDEVTVSIDIPLDANAYVPNQFVAGKTVTRRLTLRREGIR